MAKDPKAADETATPSLTPEAAEALAKAAAPKVEPKPADTAVPVTGDLSAATSRPVVQSAGGFVIRNF